MAEPLTRDQMEFLAEKLGYEITYLSDTTVEKRLNGYWVLLTDGTIRPFRESDHNFWAIYSEDNYKFNPGYEYEVLVSYIWDSTVNDRRSDSYIKLIPKDFIPACKKYFGGTPLYVGTKRVNQAICKVGGYSRRYKGYTSKRMVVSKRSCDCGVAG